MSGERLCPLCDLRMTEEICATHGVPTISTARRDTAPARLEVGTIIVGRYRIEGLLDQGGMGALLRARQIPGEREVVLKVLKGQRVKEAANVRRFYQEARVASALSHPNIVRIIEFGIDDATQAPFLAMEHVEGRTLKDIILDQGPMTEVAASLLFAQICDALVEAHDKSVLHRDLKPSNIMVSRLANGAPLVKVLDFGLAKIIEGDEDTAPLTQPGKTVGTPAFMAPEQVTQRPQDFRTDLYGLGCMLHAALTGAPPFSGDDLIGVMRKQMREPAPPLPDRLIDGRPPSPALRALHSALLEKDKKDRPESTREVARVFRELARTSNGKIDRAGPRPIEDREIPTETGHRPPPELLIRAATTKLDPVHPHDGSSDDLDTLVRGEPLDEALLARAQVLREARDRLEADSISSSIALDDDEDATVATPAYGPSPRDQGRITSPITRATSAALISQDLETPLVSDAADSGSDLDTLAPRSASSRSALPGFVEEPLPSRVVVRRSVDTPVASFSARGALGGALPAAQSADDLDTSVVPSTLERPAEESTPLSSDPADGLLETSRLDLEGIWGRGAASTEASVPEPVSVFVPEREPARPLRTPALVLDRGRPPEGRAEGGAGVPSAAIEHPNEAAPRAGPGLTRIVAAISLGTAVLITAAVVLHSAVRGRSGEAGEPAPLGVPHAPGQSPRTAAPTPIIVPYAAPQPTEAIRVESQPARATVFLDGERVGITPVDITRPLGDQRRALRLEKRGYADEERVVSRESDETIRVRMERSRRGS